MATPLILVQVFLVRVGTLLLKIHSFMTKEEEIKKKREEFAKRVDDFCKSLEDDGFFEEKYRCRSLLLTSAGEDMSAMCVGDIAGLAGMVAQFMIEDENQAAMVSFAVDAYCEWQKKQQKTKEEHHPKKKTDAPALKRNKKTFS